MRALFVNARRFYRFLGRTFPFLHLGWIAHLREVRWDGDRLIIAGWAYTRGTGYSDAPQIEVCLRRGGQRMRIDAVVEPVINIDANARARAAEHDYSNTGFVATFDLAVLRDLPTATRPWTSTIRVIGEGRKFWGRFKNVNVFGSPAVMTARELSPRLYVTPRWHKRKGLVVDHQSVDAVATSAEAVGNTLEITVETADVRALDSAHLEGLGQSEAALTAKQGASVLAGTLPEPVAIFDEITGRVLAPTWTVATKSARNHLAVYGTPGDVLVEPRGAGDPLVRTAHDGQLQIVHVPQFIEVREAELELEPALGVRFRGSFTGDLSSTSLVFTGNLRSLPVQVTDAGDGLFEAFVPLRTSAWGGPELPAARGGYALVAQNPEGPFRTFVSHEFAEHQLGVHELAEFRLRFELNRTDQLRLGISRPRRHDELGSYRQSRLFKAYSAHTYVPRDAVYFESFFGKNATCNPRALDREIAQRFPEMRRYWAVDDLSIEVPEGATPVVTGSKEWWDARGSCRYIITNEWLRARFLKRPYQTVLQTWHGSMYKKIGLDRTGMSARHLNLVRAERANWDYFISQNAPGTEVISHAYDFQDGILETGYPRNDELQDVDDDRVAAIRDRLGVGDKRLIMYAPTWREPKSGEVDFLDLESLSAALGDDYVILLRGHVRTLEKSHVAEGVLDVSTYPQVSELFLVADALITDYSSMMFDYSVTGKPMIFFTPDIDDYSDTKVRGVYFDLAELAPGPVVRTQAEVEELLHDLDAVHDSNADKYAAWQKMFNHHDDGKASQRVVDILFADK
ncbi:MAG: CDP-glycerol glycerophosphotransferase family protein [Actinomycetota bacterium]|nr:CDP-glycerol glycerophosphotransferase family protein [Actinomycetota bacterium]